MHCDFPFEQRVRLRDAPSQLEFATRAERALGARDDCLFDASELGLTLLARNEAALAMPRQALREVFADAVEFEPVRVRITPGTPPLEPILHVRVDAPLPSLPQVRAALRLRKVVLLEEDTVRTRGILRGEGRAVMLIGVGEELETLAGKSLLLWVALARYAPVMQKHGAGDGNRTHV